MIQFSVDPGIRGCGVALFLDDNLSRAAYIKNHLEKGNGPREAAQMALAVQDWVFDQNVPLVERLVVEWPKVYQGSKQKGDPADLLPLAAIDACLCLLFPRAHHVIYTPQEWKGTVDGDVMTERIKARLTASETAELTANLKCPKHLQHNVYDGIGLGLFALGRLNPRKVIAR